MAEDKKPTKKTIKQDDPVGSKTPNIGLGTDYTKMLESLNISQELAKAALALNPKISLPDETLRAITELNRKIELPESTLKAISALGKVEFPKVRNALLDTDLRSSFRNFEGELNALQKKIEQQATALHQEAKSREDKEQRIAQLETSIAELNAKKRIEFILSRVNQDAQRLLLESEEFRLEFLQKTECNAFVIAVDIRQSTALMLKARKPEAFAEFITTLCSDLMRIITDHYGVFDKFTGDGVLAFFPDFYSGDDAAYHAITSAAKCHESFREHYDRFRKSFSSILTDVGLGIGIDFGSVHLVQMAGGLTVVGAPVVYACRLSGAPPGHTYVNQPAYEILSDRFSGYCFIDETRLDIKHEGGMLAYNVRLNGRSINPRPPQWVPQAPKDIQDKESNKQ
jgi:class 3 adenylate cyclase